MKTPAQIIGKSASGLPQPSWTSRTPTGNSEATAEPTTISNQTKTLINMLFARFMAIYGHKFKSCFETQDEIRIAKREWALSMQGYSEAELVAAISRCKETLAWMPTISEFITILNEQSGNFGLPPAKIAYEEVCRYADHPTQHDWTHVALYHAGKATGWFRLRSETEDRVFPDFLYNYQVICRRVRAGEDLSIEVPVALENKSDNTLVEFIRRWGEQQNLSPEQASTLLFYLTKPKGTDVRERFRQASQQRAESWGLSITLPDDYQ